MISAFMAEYWVKVLASYNILICYVTVHPTNKKLNF